MENAPISSEKDDISIYSEFEEPNRLRLIQEIVKLSPELTKLPRDICFSLWLADISRLEVLADPLLDNAIRCHSIRNLAPDACLIGARPCELHGPRDKDVAYAVRHAVQEHSKKFLMKL